MRITDELWPIAVYQDRYGGCYSGGAWIAVAEAETMARHLPCLVDGPYGDDTDAAVWGSAIPEWAAVGDTPDEAVRHLIEKCSEAG